MKNFILPYLTCSDTIWLFSIFPITCSLSLSLLLVLIFYFQCFPVSILVWLLASLDFFPMESQYAPLFLSPVPSQILKSFTVAFYYPQYIIRKKPLASSLNILLNFLIYRRTASTLMIVLPLHISQEVFVFPQTTGPRDEVFSHFHFYNVLFPLSVKTLRS